MDNSLSPSSERIEPSRPDTPSSQGRRIYTVQERDSLYKISRQMYGDPSRWREILEANRGVLPSESQLQPGMRLIIPSKPLSPNLQYRFPATGRRRSPTLLPIDSRRRFWADDCNFLLIASLNVGSSVSGC